MVRRLKDDEVGEVLVRRGLITRDKLAEVQAKMVESRTNFKNTLIKMGFTWNKEFVMAVGEEMGVDFIDLETFTPETELGRLIPENSARRYKALPMDKKDGILILAMADPTNSSAIEDIAIMTSLEVKPCIAEESVLADHINRRYGVSKIAPAKHEVDTNLVTASRLKELAEETPIVRSVDMIFTKALEEGASWISIEPFEENLTVSFVVDDITKEVMKPPRLLYPALNARVKMAANLDYADFKHCQQGKFALDAGDKYELSVSTTISKFGEKIEVHISKKPMMVVLQDSVQGIIQPMFKAKETPDPSPEMQKSGPELPAGPPPKSASTLQSRFANLANEPEPAPAPAAKPPEPEAPKKAKNPIFNFVNKLMPGKKDTDEKKIKRLSDHETYEI